MLAKQEHLPAYSKRIVKARIGQKRKVGTAFTLDSEHRNVVSGLYYVNRQGETYVCLVNETAKYVVVGDKELLGEHIPTSVDNMVTLGKLLTVADESGSPNLPPDRAAVSASVSGFLFVRFLGVRPERIRITVVRQVRLSTRGSPQVVFPLPAGATGASSTLASTHVVSAPADKVPGGGRRLQVKMEKGGEKPKGAGEDPTAKKTRTRSSSVTETRSRAGSTSGRGITATTRALMEEPERMAAAAAAQKTQQRKMTDFISPQRTQTPSGGAGELPSGPCGPAAGSGSSPSLTEEVANVVGHLRSLQEQHQQEVAASNLLLRTAAAGTPASSAAGSGAAKEAEDDGGWQVWTNNKKQAHRGEPDAAGAVPSPSRDLAGSPSRIVPRTWPELRHRNASGCSPGRRSCRRGCWPRRSAWIR